MGGSNGSAGATGTSTSSVMRGAVPASRPVRGGGHAAGAVARVAPHAAGGTGGGIDNAGTATLEADILADSPSSNCGGAAPTDGGYNVADDSTCALSAPGVSGSLSGESDAAIGLGLLAANGGPTQTQAISPSSVAAGLVPKAACDTTDQRGVPRLEPPSSTTCDAGAFELAPPGITGLGPSPAATGATVTLSGYGFTLAGTVDVNGATTPFAVVSDAQITFVVPSGSGTVPVKVVNPDGTSNAVTFTYDTAPAVTGQPAGQTVAAGQPAMFTVACSGAPAPTIQWQTSTDGGASWSDIAGATSSTLTIAAVPATDNGDRYRAVCTIAGSSVTSNAATLTVLGLYWLVTGDAGVFTFGGARSYGPVSGSPVGSVVGMAATPDGAGYWMATADGGVFAYGDAHGYGSAAGLHLNRPVVGMAATPDGGGYWLVAADGGVFAFGDATFHGSAAGLHLDAPVVGIAATPDGGGYWLVAADGGVFAFGDAAFHGSAVGFHLNRPVVGMATTPDGGGYWLVAGDGGVFTFGDAPFYGSEGGTALSMPVVGMAANP